MKSGFDYEEYKQWANLLDIPTYEFRLWLKKFLLQEAQRVVAKGKPRTPVDTGFLRNSWYIGSQKITQEFNDDGKAVIDISNSDIASIKVVGNVLQVEIGLSAEYASFIEYGHHSYEGQYMLEISIFIVQRQLPARFNTEWLKFLKQKGI